MSNLQELLHIGFDEEPQRPSARQTYVDKLELPAVFAPRIEGERAGELLSGGDGARLGLERRASATALGRDDGRRARRCVVQVEAQHGNFARVQPSETNRVGGSMQERAVRYFDDFPPRGGTCGLFERRLTTPRGERQQRRQRRRSRRSEQDAESLQGGGVGGVMRHRRSGARLSDKSAARLLDAALGRQRLDNLVQHAVDEDAAARRRVVLRDFDVLVERHLDGNRGEVEQLGHRRADDEVVHEDDALDVPVGGELLDVALVLAEVDQRLLEERLDELRVLLALELRGHLQLGVGGAEVGERAQNHHEDVAQVVVPENRHLLEHRVERLALLQALEEILDQLAVVGKRALAALHVALVVVAFGELCVERADELGVEAPVELAGGRVVVHRVGVGDDADDRVVDELGVGVEVLVGRQLLLPGQLLTVLGIAGNLDRQGQHQVVEVVGLVHRRHQVLFRGHHVVGARFQMGEQRLDDLDAK